MTLPAQSQANPTYGGEGLIQPESSLNSAPSLIGAFAVALLKDIGDAVSFAGPKQSEPGSSTGISLGAALMLAFTAAVTPVSHFVPDAPGTSPVADPTPGATGKSKVWPLGAPEPPWVEPQKPAAPSPATLKVQVPGFGR